MKQLWRSTNANSIERYEKHWRSNSRTRRHIVKMVLTKTIVSMWRRDSGNKCSCTSAWEDITLMFDVTLWRSFPMRYLTTNKFVFCYPCILIWRRGSQDGIEIFYFMNDTKMSWKSININSYEINLKQVWIVSLNQMFQQSNIMVIRKEG